MSAVSAKFLPQRQPSTGCQSSGSPKQEIVRGVQYTETGLTAPGFNDVTLTVPEAQVGDVVLVSQVTPDPVNDSFSPVLAKTVTVAGQVVIQVYTVDLANISGTVDLVLIRE